MKMARSKTMYFSMCSFHFASIRLKCLKQICRKFTLKADFVKLIATNMLVRFYVIVSLVLSMTLTLTMAEGTDVCSMAYQAENGLVCRYCPQGTYVSADCVESWGNPECRLCPDNFYQPNCNRARSCAPCYPCARHGAVELVPCTATQNAECVCPGGKYFQKHSSEDGLCLQHKTCPVGYGVVKTGTPLDNTVCGECQTGTYSNSDSSDDHCKPCIPCQEYWSHCSNSHDAICRNTTELTGETTPERNLDLNIGLPVGMIVSLGILIAVLVYLRRNGFLPCTTSNFSEDSDFAVFPTEDAEVGQSQQYDRDETENNNARGETHMTTDAFRHNVGDNPAAVTSFASNGVAVRGRRSQQNCDVGHNHAPPFNLISIDAGPNVVEYPAADSTFASNGVGVGESQQFPDGRDVNDSNHVTGNHASPPNLSDDLDLSIDADPTNVVEHPAADSTFASNGVGVGESQQFPDGRDVNDSNHVTGNHASPPNLGDDKFLSTDACPVHARPYLQNDHIINGHNQHVQLPLQNGHGINGHFQNDRPPVHAQHDRSPRPSSCLNAQPRSKSRHGDSTSTQIPTFIADNVLYTDFPRLLRKCQGVSIDQIDKWIDDANHDYPAQGCREKMYQIMKKYCQVRNEDCYDDICQAMRQCSFNELLEKFETSYKQTQPVANRNTNELTHGHAQDTKAVFVDNISINEDRHNYHGVQYVGVYETLTDTDDPVNDVHGFGDTALEIQELKDATCSSDTVDPESESEETSVKAFGLPSLR